MWKSLLAAILRRAAPILVETGVSAIENIGKRRRRTVAEIYEDELEYLTELEMEDLTLMNDNSAARHRGSIVTQQARVAMYKARLAVSAVD